LHGASVSLGRGTALAGAIMSQPPLAGTARVLPPGFVRNSCCLFYRVPGAGLCADCILR
jgi:ferric iron reductase protein FhuF